MPRINITGSQNDLGIGIGLDELFGKGTGRPITNSLAVTQQLIPFFPPKLSNAVVLGEEGVMPHQTIRGVLNRRGHHVVGLDIAQSLEGLAEG